MASRNSAERFTRKIAHYGLAGVVMVFFVLGLATTTLVRRLHRTFDVWRPRTEIAMRTIHPGIVELQGLFAALMMFAEAIAEELLGAFWKPRAE